MTPSWPRQGPPGLPTSSPTRRSRGTTGPPFWPRLPRRQFGREEIYSWSPPALFPRTFGCHDSTGAEQGPPQPLLPWGASQGHRLRPIAVQRLPGPDNGRGGQGASPFLQFVGPWPQQDPQLGVEENTPGGPPPPTRPPGTACGSWLPPPGS